ncbi:coproporphyrinogen-III oxidase family protein [Mixta intestinalis]|uniref:Oxygen-independent coproporphyrinogen-III oxidase-like protein n=1 Tax=Mixta intestinalis TaxID=1615494 RepID=A0A6P1Q7I3_9GAMM|nr:coproporphyrinogen-III oxidase family protein [Mixta intestinalis]QHM73997.1 Oxygen-independent coproporphyrinogen-III oxidase-like protein [Mixta intestinalis]
MYKNRCYMPFILYPPDMYDVFGQEMKNNLVDSLALNSSGTDFVMYISIPYCRVCCKACPYFMELLPMNSYKTHETLDRYVDALITDLRNHASTKRWSTAKLRGVYIGGGTGSLLEIKHLDKILTTLEQGFNLSEDCEITLEGNAKDFDIEKSKFIASSLINRVSLGAQSFQPEVLKVVGAPHKARQTISTIKMLQDTGVNHISLDMMYNMPEHTVSQWEKDFKVLHELGIQHLTTYLYRITPGTRQDALIKSGKVVPVADAESMMVKEMQLMIRQFAADAGMQNYMYEHFSLPGFESRYNHWTMKECVDALGVGPGAYSFINQRRTGTSKDVERYIRDVMSGENTFTTASSPLSPIISRQRYIIFNLLYYRIDKEHYKSLWGAEPVVDFGHILNGLIQDGMVYDEGPYLVVTEKGKQWLQNIMLEFFDDSMWENSTALEQQQSSWAMNNHMIDLGSSSKSFWLAKI